MKTTLTSNWRPLLRVLYAFLIAAAALWAMPRNACAQLYVTEFAGSPLIGVVGKYDAKTGAAINASFITGLNGPAGLAVLGNTLFVARNAGNTVGKYDAPPPEAAISPQLHHRAARTRRTRGVGLGNTLFVANRDGNTVGKYDATTGAAINASFITGLNTPV